LLPSSLTSVCYILLCLSCNSAIQGETVRQMKTDKKPKEAVDAEVEKLKTLKAELEKLVGVSFRSIFFFFDFVLIICL